MSRFQPGAALLLSLLWEVRWAGAGAGGIGDQSRHGRGGGAGRGVAAFVLGRTPLAGRAEVRGEAGCGTSFFKKPNIPPNAYVETRVLANYRFR